jgi:hypothetical protein
MIMICHTVVAQKESMKGGEWLGDGMAWPWAFNPLGGNYASLYGLKHPRFSQTKQESYHMTGCLFLAFVDSRLTILVV